MLIDHNNEETLPIVLDTGCWAGHTIYPNTKMDEQRMAALVKKYGTDRIIVNSAADWGISDPLKVPKTIDGDARSRASPTTPSRQIVWDNPVAFFAQSGRFDVADLDAAARDRSHAEVRNELGAARRADAQAALTRSMHPDRGPQRRRADRGAARRPTRRI